jgi:5,10-methylenetetrahydromethanopterin reductase
VWLFPNATPPELLEAIKFADSAGIDDVWLGDEGPSGWDPFAICAAAAMQTSRVVLGVAVANPISRHPGATTLNAMTISELSQGRFRLAYGPGGSLPLDPFGLAVTTPVPALEWAMRLSRCVARGEALEDERGGYIPPAGARVFPELPLWVGARGPRLNDVAARLADGVFLSGIDRYQLPIVAEWARSNRLMEAPIEVATYLTACFDAETLWRCIPQFVHGLANGPVATLSALEVEATQVRIASEKLRDGNDVAAREILQGRVLDAVLAAGSTAHIASLLTNVAATTAASSIGIAVIGSRPLEDIKSCVDVFRAMDLISRP